MAGQDNGIQTGAVPNIPVEQITVERETTDGVLDPSFAFVPMTIGTAASLAIPENLSYSSQLQDVASLCEVAFNSLSSYLQNAIDGCRTDCINSTGDCCKCIESSIQKAIDLAATACQKCQDKAMSAVGSSMGAIIDYAGAAGLQLGFAPETITILPSPVEPPPHGGPPVILPEPIGQLPPPIHTPCIPGSPGCPLPPLPHLCPPGSHWDSGQNACVSDNPPPPPPPGPPGPIPPGGNCGQQITSCTAGTSGLIGCNLPPALLQQARDQQNDQTLQNCTVDENGTINNMPCVRQILGDPNNSYYVYRPPAQNEYNPPQGFDVPCQTPPASCGCPTQPTVSTNDVKTFTGFTSQACSPDGAVSLGEDIDRLAVSDQPQSVSAGAGTSGILSSGDILKKFGSGSGDPISWAISKGISYVFSFLTGIADNYLDYAQAGSSCSTATTRILSVRYAFAFLIDKLTGSIPDGDLERMKMEMNYVCPWKIPSTSQLNDLNNSGWITDAQWRSSIKFNGDCEEWQSKMQRLSQTRPTLSDAVTLKLRDVIDDETYKDYIEKQGADRDEFADTFQTLRDQWPSGDETISFATYGIFDENFVDKYQLLAGAEVLQQDNVKKYLKAAAIPDSLAQLRWIASRQLPSIPQINEWLNRLRPDRTKVNDPLPNVDFTEDDAKELYKYHGIPERFADKIMAMRHKPISFRHIANAYIYGKMDDKDVIDAYKSMGYSDDVADALGGGLIKVNAHKKHEYEGQVPEKVTKTAYKYSIINDDIASQLLVQVGYDQDISQQRVSEWKLERDAEETIALTKVIKRRYMRGDFSDADAHSKLITARVDPDRVDTIVSNWREQREANTKIPAVQQLCGWFGQGLIDASTYVTRLQNLGWQPQDALNIVGKCVNDKVEKELKAAIAAAEKAARQAKQAERDRQKKLKDMLPCKPKAKPPCPKIV
jgi:hypothetical protein